MAKPETMMIDDVKYIREDSVKSSPATNTEGLPYVIIRGDRSGVFAGYLKSHEDRAVLMHNCRRLWYWDGAASISQLANEGSSKKENCKFTQPVASMRILDAIEILDATEEARDNIESIPVWSK